MEINSIHSEFHTVLKNYIAKRVNNKTDVEDLLQEVFIRIFRALPGLHNDEKLRSWIFTIARNTITDHYRRKAGSGYQSDADYLTDLPEENEESESALFLGKCIRKFIAQLPEAYRDIVIDSEINGIRQKELAEKYGMEYTSLRSRVQRGRARLKDMFLECCRIELDRRGNVMDANPRDGSCNNCASF